MSRKPKAAPAMSAEDTVAEDGITIPIEAIREYAGNPRHNDHAVESMAAIMSEHGFRVPVLVRTGEDREGYDLIDGHLRLKAARRLGIEDIPALLVDDMSPEQVRAFRISVNRAAELAGWNYDLLAAELKDLGGVFENLAPLTGFDDEALGNMAKEQEKTITPSRSDPVNRQADQRKATRDTDSVNLSLGMTAAERERCLSDLDRIREALDIPTRSAVVLHLTREAVGKLLDSTTKKARTRSRKG